MSFIDELGKGICDSFIDLRNKPLKTIGLSLGFLLSFLLTGIPIIGGLIGGYIFVKLLELVTNKKPSNLAYYSALVLFTILSIHSLLPPKLDYYFILSFIYTVFSIALFPQLYTSFFGRKKFKFSKGDLVFSFKVIISNAIITFLALSFILGFILELLMVLISIAKPLLTSLNNLQSLTYFGLLILLLITILMAFPLYIMQRVALVMAENIESK